MQKKLITGIAGVAVAAGMGLGMTQLAQAETPTPAPTTSTSASTPSGDDSASTEHRTGGRGHRGTGMDATSLATKLGLPEETVSEALSAVRDESDASRPSSDATREEKDAAKGVRQAEFITALAAELDLDEATVTTALTELQTEREADKSADQKAVLEEAVTEETLTQSEADAVQKAVDAGIASIRGAGHGRR